MENSLDYRRYLKETHLLIETPPSSAKEEASMALTKKYNVKIAPSPKQKRVKSKKDGIVFAIEGVHGVGKTTLYQILGDQFQKFPNIKFLPERLRPDPPVPFGSKDKQTAFRSEIHYNQQMIQRNGIVKKFIQNQRENIVILDRSPLSTLVYSRALSLPKIDYELIQDTYTSVDWMPEFVLFLEADPKTLMERICHRGCLDNERKNWNEEDLEYIKRVLEKYQEIFDEYKLKEKNRLVRIKTESKTPEEIAEEILKTVEQKTGMQILKSSKVPKNQSKLTNWIN